jgi:hypothetical protein
MMPTTATERRFDYGYVFRQLAEAARKSGDVSAKHLDTPPEKAVRPGKTDRYGTPS